MIRRRRSRVLEAAIVEARKGGAKIAAVAKLCDRSERTVYKVLHGAGLVKPQRPTRLALDTVAELRALRADGIRIKELATRFGVSRVTVWKKLKGEAHVYQR